MCLLKVYVEDEGTGRRLVARDVAFILKEGETVKLRNIEFEETMLTNVDIFSIDALGSVLILKKREIKSEN